MGDNQNWPLSRIETILPTRRAASSGWSQNASRISDFQANDLLWKSRCGQRSPGPADKYLDAGVDLHLGSRLGIVGAPGPDDVDGGHNRGRREKNPFQCPKSGSGLGSPANVAPAEEEIAQEDSQCDESGEPEQHGNNLSGQDAELVSGCREEPRRQSQIGDCEDGGPYATEEEEVDLRRRGCQGGGVVPGRDVGSQGQDEDCEDPLRNAQRKHEVEGHCSA